MMIKLLITMTFVAAIAVVGPTSASGADAQHVYVHAEHGPSGHLSYGHGDWGHGHVHGYSDHTYPYRVRRFVHGYAHYEHARGHRRHRSGHGFDIGISTPHFGFRIGH